MGFYGTRDISELGLEIRYKCIGIFTVLLLQNLAAALIGYKPKNLGTAQLPFDGLPDHCGFAASQPREAGCIE
jgi:hypothetical protein